MRIDSVQNSYKKKTKPSVMTDSVVRNLAKQIGGGYSVEMACALTGISRTSYYSFVKNNSAMAEIFEIMKRMPSERAMHNVVEAIENKDLKVSMWYLEKFNQNFEFSISYKTRVK